MRLFTNALLASVLAIVAGSVAGCDDATDCPAAVSAGASCTASGLTCYAGQEQCTCSGGKWDCKAPDMSIPHDMRPANNGD